jgi:NADPH-dependent 2,4-dienoyl-CoA reductase/sulfur reductase-like enzyme/nitrite reductase/ring-hydroxylating ferredoxin subunit
VLLLKVDGNFYALYPYCTHYGGPLEEGLLHGRRLICPWHHACFDACSGEHLEAPGLDGVPAYEVQVDGDDVIVKVPEDSGDRTSNPMTAADPSDGRTYVVLGGGAAGAYAAEGMRQAGYKGRIVMITAEEELPYDRPNCSKAYLSGEAPEEWMPLRSASFYKKHQIEVRTNHRVTQVNAPNKIIEFEEQEPMSYDKILLCTGGVPRRLKVPGMDLEKVHTLRSLADSRRIREEAEKAEKAVIIGASFIGMESAASLLEQDCEVTVVAPEKVPFAKVFGEKIGHMMQRMHEEKGVQFMLGHSVKDIEGNGRAETVVLDNGERLEAGLVLAGIGVVPNTGYVRGIPIEIDGGIRADEHLHVLHDLYVAGDIAHFPANGGTARIEHWTVACQQGLIAGMNMADEKRTFDKVPFFWTRQHGVSLVYLGHADDYDRILYDGSVDDQSFLAFYVKDDEVRAVAGMGRSELKPIQELMREGKMPGPAKIEKGGVDWMGLLGR